ncbi:hypothetical protein [Thalassoroseus pseudoceratinae]|uniref:hypothetical protein n=1 Tax=Thalassoroseus pseudoceratinae TaxID=2713176 RepID=UPI001422F7EB|nr:hypothetical protein [Thalassoroseus pseudoceratinae]
MNYIDLLSPTFQAQMRDRAHRRFWPIAVIVSVLFAGLCIYTGYRTLDDLRNTTKQLRHKTAPIYKQKSQTSKMRAASREVAQKNSLVHTLEHNRPPSTLVSVVSAGSRSLDGTLHVHELRLTRKERAPVEPPKKRQTKGKAKSKSKKPTVYDHQLIILGTAENEVAVTKFIDALRQAKVFRSVQLRSTLPSLTIASERQFEVACVY